MARSLTELITTNFAAFREALAQHSEGDRREYRAVRSAADDAAAGWGLRGLGARRPRPTGQVDRSESGQMLMIAGLLAPILIGMCAIAVDIGSYASERRTLQNQADAIALAAAQELPDESAAQDVADEWAEEYDIPSGNITVTTAPATSSSPNPQVRVVITDSHGFAFIGALGVGSKQVSAAATAVKTSPGGFGGLVPWAILESTKDGANPGDLVTLKYDANNVNAGNFGAIRIDGNGGSVHRETIEDGSDYVICSQEMSGCGEDSPVCNDYICKSQTGNMVGPTKTAVDYRMDNTDSHCDELDEVLLEGDSEGEGSGETYINPDCNPWTESKYESRRLIATPIIASLCNGSCDLTVTGFALFWLEGYGSGCTGNACEVQGRFVDAEASVGGLLGIYDEDSSNQFARLIE